MTDKERLEEIKRIYVQANEIENINGVSIIAMSEEDKDWLIKQAERAETLERLREEDSTYYNELLTKLRERNQRYKQALEFYADENNYREHDLKGIVPPRPIAYKPILHDYGNIARQALESDEN